MCPDKLKFEVVALSNGGMEISAIEQAGQCFVVVRGLASPSPPWGAALQDIAVAAPIAYETAGLDGFYLRRPYSYKGGTHPRVSGQTVQLDGANWQLVSWHYPERKLWISGQDDLASHIEHCRGFFLDRKAINAIQ